MVVIPRRAVPTVKVAISIDSKLLDRLDRFVVQKRFAGRSGAIQMAIEAALTRFERRRLARECAKLDLRSEQRLAEEGAASDLEGWPKY
jgi:Arc/MetJ-type ribon-helix-helix transcriptional regulator